MRTLNKNKVPIWYVNLIGKEPILDKLGFDTGEFENKYSTPTNVMINLYPANGKVVERIFGKDVSLDMTAVTNDIILNEDSLIFLSEPTTNDYKSTYKYRVSNIKKSLNTINYGLVMRT